MVQPLPIVLLHGVGLDHTMWEPLRAELARFTDRPVVALGIVAGVNHAAAADLRERRGGQQLAHAGR